MEKTKPEFPEKLFDWSFSFSSRKFKWENVQAIVAVMMCLFCYAFILGYAVPQFEKSCFMLWGNEKFFPSGIRVLMAVEHHYRPFMPVFGLMGLGLAYHIHRTYRHFAALGFPETHWMYKAETWKYSVPLFWAVLCSPLAFAMFAIVQVCYQGGVFSYWFGSGGGPR